MSARALTGGLALVLAAAQPGGAQHTGVVYGVVRDSGGRALIGARIRIAGAALETHADAAGTFRLPAVPAGRRTIGAEMIGFRSASAQVDVAAGDSVHVAFTLAPTQVILDNPPPVILQPVIVTAAKRSQLLEEAVTSVAVVDEAQLARRAVNTLDEAVDKAPGVQFLSGQINIRGSTGFSQGLNSRVLLLVDGVPANQGDRGGIHWDLLPLDQVESVEIVKGAGSALYGSAALGGVVNVITRQIPAGWHARVRATGGAFADPPHAVWRFRDARGLHGGLDVTSSYGTERVRASLAAGGRHSDGYREQDERDHWQLAGKSEWHPGPATRVAVSGAWAVDDYLVPIAWCNPGECDARGQAFQPFRVDESERRARTDSRKGYLSATLDRTPSERLTWQLRGSWVRTRFHDRRRTAEDFSRANKFGAEVRAVARPAATRVVTVGAEAALSDVDSDIFGTHTQGEYAAYGESEHRLGEARLTTGARIDFLSVDHGGLSAVVSPRAGAVLPAAGGVWRASLGRGFRAPTLAERFVHTTVFGFEVVPSPALDPETAWSFEAGHARQLGTAARLDAALFWTEARDLIEPGLVLLPQGPRIQFRNVARARLAGLDAAATASLLTPGLEGTLAYTYLHARQLAREAVAEQPLAFRPRHLVTATADYAQGRIGVGADFRYSSRVDRIELESLLGSLVDGRRVAVKVLDLRASYAHGPLATRLIVANALNYLYNLVPESLAPVRTISVTLVWTY